jgi:ATP-dependent Clp protease adapter protein ClpS
MSDNLPMAGHYREAYGDALRKIIIVLTGMGVNPGRVRMERAHAPTHATRAQFDILLRADDNTMEYVFEAKTIEELNIICEVMDLTKELMLNCHEKGDLVMTEEALFRGPNAINLKLALQGSFNEDFARLIVPEAMNGNSPVVQQRAASHMTSGPKQKDPVRVAAGRKASAKRWSAPPASFSNAPQTTAPKI